MRITRMTVENARGEARLCRVDSNIRIEAKWLDHIVETPKRDMPAFETAVWEVAAARKASLTSLGHAGASIRLTARRSIKRSPAASAPGRPPRTHRRRETARRVQRPAAPGLMKQRPNRGGRRPGAPVTSAG